MKETGTSDCDGQYEDDEEDAESQLCEEEGGTGYCRGMDCDDWGGDGLCMRQLRSYYSGRRA